jgi:hypothetical protein
MLFKEQIARTLRPARMETKISEEWFKNDRLNIEKWKYFLKDDAGRKAILDKFF